MNETLNALITNILEEHAPSEVGLFKTVGKDLIANSRTRPRRAGSELAESTFAPDLESGVLMLHLVAGTLSLVEIYTASRRRRSEKLLEGEVQSAWEEFLIKRGVPPFLAHQIQVRYGKELFRILNSDREN